MTQDQALSILKTGVNLFLTGEPGSGKTYVINQYVTYLRQHQIEVAVTASTGIAATHINGMTIHSWSGIGIKDELSDKDLKAMAEKSRLAKRVKTTKVLIIDEISMLSAQTLELVDMALRYLRDSDLPFGGLQVVFVGDFFQLPPVSRSRDTVAFAFASEVWTQAKPVVCYLTEQHRQSDDQFSALLQSVRSGNNASADYALLQTRQVEPQANNRATRLYSHNRNVDFLNQEKLEALSEKSRSFTMSSKGRKALVEQLKKGCLSPELLVLKVGAQVMFTKNNYDEGYVNGTLGEVVSFREGLPVVVTNQGQTIEVMPVEWSIEDNGKVLASISQLPLRLAWAITVHKSQGMTLDAAIIDLSEAFEFGQGYVAISRVKSLLGLWLLGINQRALQVHPEVSSVDREFQAKSQKMAEFLTQYSAKEMQEKHRQFITRVGGSHKPVKIDPKLSTQEKTLQLFLENLSLSEIAVARKITEKTIVGHLEKLKTAHKLSTQQLSRVIPDKLQKVLPKIHQAFLDSGDSKLSPVHEKLKGKYSYEELQLARLVLE